MENITYSDNDFQVAYRWRLNNNRYIYITDDIGSDGNGLVTGIKKGTPFIYYYDAGLYVVQYYSGDTIVTKELNGEISVNERDIAVYARQKFNGHEREYETAFAIVKNLMANDEFGAELTLLSYENYYNVSTGETCSVGYDKVDCDLYDLAFSGSVYKIPYGKEPLVSIAGPINIEQGNTTLKTYRMTFGVPQGPRGETGEFENMIPNYMGESGTTYFPIFRSNTHPYTTFDEETKIGLGFEFFKEGNKSKYVMNLTNERPNPELEYYLTINEDEESGEDYVQYKVKNFTVDADEGYVILTFDDEESIPGGDGYYYNTLFLVIRKTIETEDGSYESIIDYDFLYKAENGKLVLGVEEEGIETNNGFVMAFRWEDKTNTPIYKGDSRKLIFNDCKFTIYKRIVKVDSGDTNGKEIIYGIGDKIDLQVSAKTTHHETVLFQKDTTFEAEAIHSGPTTFNNYMNVHCNMMIHGKEISIKDNHLYVYGNENGPSNGVDVNKNGITGNTGYFRNKVTGQEVSGEKVYGTTVTGNTLSGITVDCETLNSRIAYETSDINTKNVIETNPNFDIDKILNLSIIYFTFKDDPKQEKRLGVIAQEIREICPEIVWEDSENILHVEYNKLSLLLLYCIKDLYKKMK